MSKSPKYLLPLSIFAILWNAMGCLDYTMTMLRNEDYLADFTPEQLDYFFSFPTWMTSAWALAVWSGLLGSFSLLFKKSFAVTAFNFSFWTMIICNGYTYVLRDDAIEMMGKGGTYFAAAIFILALYFWRISAKLKDEGVLS
jgi:hypothetical protein